ncbi:Embryo defective [Thalictrum thalictroides]|uniref:Embryo defective n=1 Tax=Thalictrum thalictroides TaxID=46969 RepID=A0A7J6UTD4_THATH|nr:Embryo defective [Thalictrum thalictroides]
MTDNLEKEVDFVVIYTGHNITALGSVLPKLLDIGQLIRNRMQIRRRVVDRFGVPRFEAVAKWRTASHICNQSLNCSRGTDTPINYKEAKEQHRNTKLLNALLRLHREVSPKLAACAADLSSPYPGSALGLGAVCHLLVSALACWPVFGWTPDLFHCLLDSVQATSSLALGPKEACSLLCLLGDLFPEEGIWSWKNGMPSLSALKKLSIATVLGAQKEGHVDWYLQPVHAATLLSRLTPLLDKIAQIILHFAFTALVVIQDMLRVFIIRIAYQNPDSAVILLRPIISWIHDRISEPYSLSDTDVFKVYRLLDFLASLLEHPHAKSLLVKEGTVGILIKALEKCSRSFGPEGKIIAESIMHSCGFILINWILPVLKSVILMCDSQAILQHSEILDNSGNFSIQDCSQILHHLLKLCQVLPVGKELHASLIAFKELSFCSEGRGAFASISTHLQSSNFDEFQLERGHEEDGHGSVTNNSDWRRCPPLLYCWRNLLRSISVRECLSIYAIEAVGALSLGALSLCVEGKSLNLERIAVLKFLFGLPIDLEDNEQCPEESLKDFSELIVMLDTRVIDAGHMSTSDMRATVSQVKEWAKLLLLLLQKPTGSIKVDDIICNGGFSLLSSDIRDHFTFTSVTMMGILDEDSGSLSSRIRKSDGSSEKADDLISFSGLADKFLWDCPDSLRDNMSALPLKRKIASMELPNRRSRGDNSGTENSGPNAFGRGVGPPTVSSGPTRRDSFRQRKPNTSRPPSMHVDDYVARERNIDGASSGSNVVSSVQRGVTGGRPPSIHVDEFMARQRERQVSVAIAGGESAAPTRSVPPENDNDPDKVDRSRQLKADLDDDLQEINIVFDDEESESDDRLPFPQPDDNLQPAPVVIDSSPPHSIVEETASDANGSTHVANLGTPSASNVDENTQSEFSSRRSFSRPEMPLSREASISSERKYFTSNTDKPFFRAKSDDAKHSVSIRASNAFDSATANFSGFPPPFYKGSPSSGQLAGDSRMSPSNFYQRDSPQHAPNMPLVSGSQGHYNQKFLPNQPPLPPMPPPPNVSCVSTENTQSHLSSYGHNVRDRQPPLPPGFPSQAFEGSGSINAPVYNAREDRSTPHNYAAGSNPPSSSSSFVESLNDPSALQLQSDYINAYNTNSAAILEAQHGIFDSKYSWASVSSASRLHDEINSSTSGLVRPPPLPPTPPPFSAALITQPSVKNSASQSPGYNQTNVGGNLTSYSPPQLVPPLLNSRPASIPVSLFSTPTNHQGQNLPGLSHSISTTQPSIISVQPRPLQPLQPPQPPHPHPPHLRPPNQGSQQQSEVALLQSPIQVQSHPFQIPQQSHISPIQVYYPPQQLENLAHTQQPQQVELSQLQALQQQGDNTPQQQQDAEMSLQQYFSSPEAIQSLLSDREKLCQLLEQNPKLMQMLQERLGQL